MKNIIFICLITIQCNLFSFGAQTTRHVFSWKDSFKDSPAVFYFDKQELSDIDMGDLSKTKVLHLKKGDEVDVMFPEMHNDFGTGSDFNSVVHVVALDAICAWLKSGVSITFYYKKKIVPMHILTCRSKESCINLTCADFNFDGKELPKDHDKALKLIRTYRWEKPAIIWVRIVNEFAHDPHVVEPMLPFDWQMLIDDNENRMITTYEYLGNGH